MYFYVVPVHISVMEVIQFSNSHNMLNQQKQEMAQGVPDTFACEGVVSEDKTRVRGISFTRFSWYDWCMCIQ